jgi:hypothetical protein
MALIIYLIIFAAKFTCAGILIKWNCREFLQINLLEKMT